ncbi:FitA-like ribbon-helix-helix domain-containing protein [Candidatus Palauibacter sp.]|uniref:FitA-like ribbon-helix-helix domain-containing protein n=1 Tax=Candidatus Palauibacter sp. TaxID=3101350 RepID=UPI003B02B022
MSKMLQIRNVPDDVHRRLKSRAALAGTSMSDYVLREIEQSLEQPTREELFARIAQLPPIELHPPARDVLREERERR